MNAARCRVRPAAFLLPKKQASVGKQTPVFYMGWFFLKKTGKYSLACQTVLLIIEFFLETVSSPKGLHIDKLKVEKTYME